MLGELATYRSEVPACDMTLTEIRVGLMGKRPTEDEIQQKLLASPLRATKAETADIEAWERSGFAGTLSEFLRKRKATNG